MYARRRAAPQLATRRKRDSRGPEQQAEEDRLLRSQVRRGSRAHKFFHKDRLDFDVELVSGDNEWQYARSRHRGRKLKRRPLRPVCDNVKAETPPTTPDVVPPEPDMAGPDFVQGPDLMRRTTYCFLGNDPNGARYSHRHTIVVSDPPQLSRRQRAISRKILGPRSTLIESPYLWQPSPLIRLITFPKDQWYWLYFYAQRLQDGEQHQIRRGLVLGLRQDHGGGTLWYKLR